MKHLWAHPVFRSRYLLAIVSGLLLTCAFPKTGIAGMAWLAPGLMVTAALGTRGGEAFRIGYVAGLAHYLSMLYWLLLIPFRWHGIPLGPALGWVVLSAFLALFSGVWVWGILRVPSSKPKVQSPGNTVHGPREEVQSSKFKVQSPEPTVYCPLSTACGPQFLPETWLRRVVWMVGGAAGWVGLEMVLTRIFGGFPWDLLGVSQYRMTPLIQIASVTGVYGISFIVAWVSLSLLSAGVMLIRRPTARSVWLAEIFLPVLVAAGLFNFGFRQIRHEPAAGRKLKVLLVQPSIPQTLIWNPSQDTNRFNELVAYSDRLLTNKPSLMVWPESAVPKMLRYDTNTFDAISGLARKHGAWLIVGSDDAEPKRGSGNPDEADFFNSSFLISPEGVLVERYLKRNLVIFGEYLPLQEWLPFLKWFTPVQGGFTAGNESAQFHLEDLDVTTSVLICFEDIFPQLGRSGMKSDTDFLVNITNDGWFGESAAQWQQTATALFRTVENRVPLIRCCNNGVTCWIDAYGRVQQIMRDDRGTVYGEGYLLAEIPLAGAGERLPLTFYTRHGDVFGWSCVALAGILFLARWYLRCNVRLVGDDVSRV